MNAEARTIVQQVPAEGLVPTANGAAAPAVAGLGKGWVTVTESAAATYIGQVERDPDGVLWAVLYCGALLISRERFRSFRKAKRRVADLVLSASDTFVLEPYRASPTHMNRLVEKRATTPRHRPATAHGRNVPASVAAAAATRAVLAP